MHHNACAGTLIFRCLAHVRKLRFPSKIAGRGRFGGPVRVTDVLPRIRIRFRRGPRRRREDSEPGVKYANASGERMGAGGGQRLRVAFSFRDERKRSAHGCKAGSSAGHRIVKFYCRQARGSEREFCSGRSPGARAKGRNGPRTRERGRRRIRESDRDGRKRLFRGDRGAVLLLQK